MIHYIQTRFELYQSLCALPEHHAIKAWEWRYSSTHSLTSALDGGEWSDSRPAALPKGKEPMVPTG
jgi:hypothetical protein